MSILVPISRARARLSELVREAAETDVVLMNHGSPVAVMMSVQRYEALLEEMEDLRDLLSVYQREDVTIPAHKLAVELGLADIL
jgi:antitoxin StbD